MIPHRAQRTDTGLITPLTAILSGALMMGAFYWNLFSNWITPRHVADQAIVKTIPSVVQEKGQIIPGFPEFPVYPKSVIDSSQVTQANGSASYEHPSYQAYLTSKDPVSTVIAWYAGQLEGSNWVLVRAADTGSKDDQNIVVKKADLNASVNAERESGETTISIHIGYSAL